MGVQKLSDLLGLVSGKVIHNDMNLLFWFAELDHLTQKVDELVAGMTCGRFSVYLAGLIVEPRSWLNVDRYQQPSVGAVVKKFSVACSDPYPKLDASGEE